MGSRRAVLLEHSSLSTFSKALAPSIERVRREPRPLSSVAGVTCEMPGSRACLWGCSFSAVSKVVPAALTHSLHLAAVICFPEAAWY